MLLKYEDEVETLPRDKTVFNTVFKKVNNIISKENKIFSHLIIDGNEIYEDHESYIIDRLDEIIQVEIVAMSMEVMIWNTMESVHQYLERAIPAIEQLAIESKEEFSEQSWAGIHELSEGMEWMLQFVTFTNRAKHQPKNWNKINGNFKRCEEQFSELLEATENKDTVLMTHLLSFGIIPSYETLKENLAVSLQDIHYIERKEQ